MKDRFKLLLLALALGSIGAQGWAQQPGVSNRAPEKGAALSLPGATGNDRKLSLRAQAADLEAQRRATLARLDRSLVESQQAEKALRAEQRRVERGAASRSRLRPLQTRFARCQASVDTARSQLAQNTYQIRRLRSQLQQEDARNGAQNSLLLALANQGATGLAAAESPAGSSLLLRSAAGEMNPYYQGLMPLAELYPELYPGPQTMVARAEARFMTAQADLQSAEARLQAARSELEARYSQYRPESIPAAEIRRAEANITQAQSAAETARVQLGQRQDELSRASRWATLQRPIDVELRNSTLQAAVQSISQASGLAVQIDSSVSTEARFNVVARGVPMATILDSIARQSRLQIHPHDEGVILKPSPSLEVNGERSDFMSPFAPWSSEWGMNPSASMGYGGNLPIAGTVLLDAGGPTDARVQLSPTPPVAGSAADPKGARSSPRLRTVAPNAPASGLGVDQHPSSRFAPVPQAPGSAAAPAPMAEYLPPSALRAYPDARGRLFYEPTPRSGFRFLSPAGQPGSVAVTALSQSSFVVAHPSAAPGGEPAVLLTVYRLDGSQLRMVSTTLHRLGTAPGQRGNVPATPMDSYRVRPRPTAPPAAKPSPESVPARPPSQDAPGSRR